MITLRIIEFTSMKVHYKEFRVILNTCTYISHRWGNGKRARLECGRSWDVVPVGLIQRLSTKI